MTTSEIDQFSNMACDGSISPRPTTSYLINFLNMYFLKCFLGHFGRWSRINHQHCMSWRSSIEIAWHKHLQLMESLENVLKKRVSTLYLCVCVWERPSHGFISTKHQKSINDLSCGFEKTWHPRIILGSPNNFVGAWVPAGNGTGSQLANGWRDRNRKS